jgi:hypothetical protein
VEREPTTLSAPVRDAAAAVFAPSPRDFALLGGRDLTAGERRRVERMHQRAPMIVDRAREVGVDIAYLGVAQLFNEPRVYRGVGNDWTLGPIDDDHPAVFPREQQRLMQQLAEANAAPFLAYVAHEIDRSKRAELLPHLPETGHAVVSREQAAELVGPVPDHAATLQLAEQLDRQSTTVLSAIRKGAPVAGAALLGVLAAPFVLAGAALASAATLDPILIGAVPILRADVNEPALFFELARWDW